MGFNAAAFAQQSFNQATSTEYAVPPDGDYPMQIGNFDEKTWFRVSKFKDRETGQERELVSLEVPMEILDEGVKAKMGRNQVFTRYSCILDFDAAGNLDFGEGKNIRLGRLREVLGQNVAGQAWGVQMLAGKGPFMGHNAVSSSEKDPERKFANVTRVSKMGA